MAEERLLPIEGDVEAVADASISMKDGSMTETLRKAVRAGLGEVTDHLHSAALQFRDGTLSGSAQRSRRRRAEGEGAPDR